MLLAMRGEPEAGVAVGRRNCELTDRLGGVFSRSLALGNLGAAQLAAEDYEGRSDRSTRPSASTARRWTAATSRRRGAVRCAPRP